MKGLFAFLASVLVAGSAFAAPPMDTEATLSIYVRNNPMIAAVSEKAIARFNEKYPNVTVDVQTVPMGGWGEYVSGILNQIASGDTPDVISTAIEGFSELASKGVVVPLRDIMAADETAGVLLDDIDTNLLDGMARGTGGQLYFFPMAWNNIVVYYNKDLFDEAGVAYPQAGWTWSDFRAAALALTKRDDSGQAIQFGTAVPGFDFGLAPWLLTNGTDKLTADWSESNVRDPKFRESMEFLHALIWEDRSAPLFEVGNSDGLFTTKQVAMYASGHWAVPGIVNAGLENVGVQVMPANRVETTVFGVDAWGISEASENKELAWELIKELAGLETQKFLGEFGRPNPASRSVALSEPFVSFPENAEVFYGGAVNGQPIAAPSNFTQVEDIFMRHVSLYLTDNVDIDTFINDLDAELSRAMARATR